MEILICEDERLIALDLRTTILKMGFNVVDVCHSGTELIEKTKSLYPDLILTDISLKGNLSGIEAIKIIKSWKDIPFIYISGLRDDSTYSLAMETEPCGFISKPYNYLELKDKIDECMKIFIGKEKKLQINRL